MVFLTIIIIIIIIIILVLSRKQRLSNVKRVLITLGSAILAGILSFIIGICFWMGLEQAAHSLTTNSLREYTLVLTSDARQGMFSPYSSAYLKLEGGGRLGVRVLWGSGLEPLCPGLECRVSGTLIPLTEKQEFLYQRGESASLLVSTVEDSRFPLTPVGLISAFREANRLKLSSVPGEGSALLRGVLIGETTDLDACEAGRVFRATGLAHLVAVSGSHLVVIATLLSWLLIKLRVPKVPQILIVLIILAAYVILTGLQVSAIRACIMTCAANFSWFLGRRSHAPSACTAAASMMLVLAPTCAFSIGFWLSVFAVLGLTIFCALTNSWIQVATGSSRSNRRKRRSESMFPGSENKAREYLIAPLGMTLTAQAATLPLTAPIFATIPLVSPLANLIVTPMITVMVGGGMVLLWSAPLIGPLADAMLRGLCLVGDGAVTAASWLAGLPFATVPVALELLPCLIAAFVLATILYLRWPQPGKKLSGYSLGFVVLVIVLLLTVLNLPLSPRVVVMDIGQGDAILIQNGKHTILIDTGQREASLLQALGRNHVSHLDAVIITHLDSDHCGALAALSSGIPVSNIYFATDLVLEKPDAEAIQRAELILGHPPDELNFGQQIELGNDLLLTVLWPRSRAVEGSNQESICLALLYDDDHDGQPESSMLLTGDAEAPELQGILDAESQQSFQILKVGHHGSRGAVTAEQLQQMGVSVALISVGEDNRYGHPTEEVLNILQEADVTTFRTDQNGDITILFDHLNTRIVCATMNIDDIG